MRKLFVVTSGTVAAGVGQDILRQVNARPESDLTVMVRFLDTARLVNRYPQIRDGEWFQMKVDPALMRAVYNDRTRYPLLNSMLYTNPVLLPKPTGNGGGSIRYNGAGAVIVNRDKMKKWLSANITALMRQEGGHTNFSVALIVSSVGATGSGSLEYLADVIAEAASEANATLPVHLDIFILQPGMDGVSPLGLANTFALYAELAASRLSQDDVYDKDYQGRIVVVGWGSERRLASIEQLQETTGTLVRLINDTSSKLVAEYQERAVDNHVLLHTDELTELPSHLSTATPVTISLGRLEEQIIQRDAARLIDNLVFGESVDDGLHSPVNQDLFLGTLKEAMDGNSAEERYESLLNYLAEKAGGAPRSLKKNFRDTILNNQPQDILPRLEGAWVNDKRDIGQNVTQMQVAGNDLIKEVSASWTKLRNETMATSRDLSLSSLRGEYRTLNQVLDDVLKFARTETRVPDDRRVTTTLKQLELATNARGRQADIERQRSADGAIRAVKENISAQLERRASPIAIDILEALVFLSADALTKLEAVLQRLGKQRQTMESWLAGRQPLNAGIAHPLELVALSYDKKEGATESEVEQYYDRVSIFSNRAKGRVKTTTETDQLASFRTWLTNNQNLEDLFKGDIDLLLRVAQDYTRAQVHEEVKKFSVLDILIDSGEQTLPQRLAQASDMSASLINFIDGFAPDREEVRHICAYCKNAVQRDILQKAVDKVFGQGRCTILDSSDPTEIVVFYYADGIPMSAINDLTTRCLDNFLRQRQNWYHQNGSTANGNQQRVNIPIYSGKSAEERVLDQEILCKISKVAGRYTASYSTLPELKGC